jgi:hypothetical protein
MTTQELITVELAMDRGGLRSRSGRGLSPALRQTAAVAAFGAVVLDGFNCWFHFVRGVVQVGSVSETGERSATTVGRTNRSRKRSQSNSQEMSEVFSKGFLLRCMSLGRFAMEDRRKGRTDGQALYSWPKQGFLPLEYRPPHCRSSQIGR